MADRLKHAPELLVGIILLMSLAFFHASNPLFLTWGNMQVVLRGSAYTGIVAVGIAFLLISGMIDISIGSISGLASVAFGMLTAWLQLPLALALLACIAIGALCGWINSQLVIRLHISAFLATISTMYIFRGVAMTLTEGYTVYPLPEMVNAFGSSEPLNLSWAWWLFLTMVIVGEYILRDTVWGLTVKATGSDRETARCTEVPVNAVNTQTFMLCGALAALAGLLMTARVQAGQPSMGQGWELNAIAAAAIGGVSLSGYTGSMIGVLLGVLLIQVLANGLVAMGASAYLQPIEVGIILACTAAMDVRRRLKLNL